MPSTVMRLKGRQSFAKRNSNAFGQTMTSNPLMENDSKMQMINKKSLALIDFKKVRAQKQILIDEAHKFLAHLHKLNKKAVHKHIKNRLQTEREEQKQSSQEKVCEASPEPERGGQVQTEGRGNSKAPDEEATAKADLLKAF